MMNETAVQTNENQHQHCVDLMIQYMEKYGIADRRTVFCRLIENAKMLGLLPLHREVMDAVLKEFGFIRQSGRIEGANLVHTVEKLGWYDVPVTVFLCTASYQNPGGWYIAAVRQEGGENRFSLAEPRPAHLDFKKTTGVWMRWDDGQDRSPFPRRKCPKQQSYTCRLAPAAERLEIYQPNPRGRRTGDCVVRAVSGVMELSWKGTMDLLASAGSTAVSSPDVFGPILEQKGGIRRDPILRDGRRLSGTEFCAELDRLYNGERIFALVGRSHAVAILPTRGADGTAAYKLYDYWDSSQRPVGTFWVFPGAAPENS